jgi:uncharacterized protein
VIGPLTKIEARILGTLIEKENIVPGMYPLSFKRVSMGSNQKLHRSPRMYITDPEVQTALDSLISYGLVESHQGRDTVRYYHIVPKTLKISRQAVPLLAVLMLRGPLTVAEMRLHVVRMYAFADVEIIKGQMRALSRMEEPLVMEVPPMEGQRERRWAQLLTGKVSIPEPGPNRIEDLQKKIANLETRLVFLEDRLGLKSKVL